MCSTLRASALTKPLLCGVKNAVSRDREAFVTNPVLLSAFDQYSRWAKYEANQHMRDFQKDKFFLTITNSLLAYDFTFKPALQVRFETCDRFLQGAFLPEKDEIIMCANVLTEKRDFQNAMKRQMIRLYDYKRSENYNFDNCKHLACTEVRAALFHSECNPAERSKMTRLRLSDTA